MNGQHLRCLLCLLAVPVVLESGGCSCGSRSTLRLSGTGVIQGTSTPDSGAGDGGSDRGGWGGGGSAGSGGVPADSGGSAAGGAGSGGAAAGGAGQGGTGMGGTAASGGRGGGDTASGGSTATGGKGGAGAGGAGSGGLAIGGSDGGAGTGGADSSTTMRRDAGDGATDPGAADGATTPLWRNSYRPFFQEVGSFAVMSLWSDDRGVFVLGQRYPEPPAVWGNLGDGWQPTYAWPEGTTIDYGQGRVRLNGFVDGPLIALSIRPCAIQFLDGQGARCSGSSRAAADVATVSAALAYAAYSNRVLRFDGTLWTQFGGPLPLTGNASALWADSSIIAVVAEGDVYLIGPEGEAVPQSGLPSRGVGAVWGFGGKDIWAGTLDGQLFHYDGATWSPRASLADQSHKIIALWGQDGTLFVLTKTELARWDGISLVVLDSVNEPGYYAGLWGNSTKEVFVAGVVVPDDPSEWVPEIRWFDGSVTRSF